MERREKQTERVLRYIKTNGSITQIEATMYLGCTRLAARIADLRSDGVVIRSERKKVRTADGSTTTVARYSLAEE